MILPWHTHDNPWLSAKNPGFLLKPRVFPTRDEPMTNPWFTRDNPWKLHGLKVESDSLWQASFFLVSNGLIQASSNKSDFRSGRDDKIREHQLQLALRDLPAQTCILSRGWENQALANQGVKLYQDFQQRQPYISGTLWENGNSSCTVSQPFTYLCSLCLWTGMSHRVSNMWSCTTLGEGIQHVQTETRDSEEAALLAELKEHQPLIPKDHWYIYIFR